MTNPLSERDWKLFRKLHTVARDRFVERVLAESGAIVNGTDSAYDRYLALYRHIHDSDRDLGEAFDDPRRSNALMKLAAMRAQQLVTDDELAQFSPESQQFLAFFATH